MQIIQSDGFRLKISHQSHCHDEKLPEIKMRRTARVVPSLWQRLIERKVFHFSDGDETRSVRRVLLEIRLSSTGGFSCTCRADKIS